MQNNLVKEVTGEALKVALDVPGLGLYLPADTAAANDQQHAARAVSLFQERESDALTELQNDRIHHVLKKLRKIISTIMCAHTVYPCFFCCNCIIS